MGANKIDVVLLKYLASALVKPAYISVLRNISQKVGCGNEGEVGRMNGHRPSVANQSCEGTLARAY